MKGLSAVYTCDKEVSVCRRKQGVRKRHRKGDSWLLYRSTSINQHSWDDEELSECIVGESVSQESRVKVVDTQVASEACQRPASVPYRLWTNPHEAH